MSERIIVDSSIVIKWVVPEIGSEQALALRKKFTLFAPELITAEIANILWKKCQRGEISAPEAAIASALLANAGIRYIPMAGLLVKATELAIALSHPAYDCIYIAAALELECPFVTADTRFLAKLRQQGFVASQYFDLTEAVVL